LKKLKAEIDLDSAVASQYWKLSNLVKLHRL